MEGGSIHLIKMKNQFKLHLVLILVLPTILNAQLISNQKNYGTQSFEFIKAAHLLDGNYIIGGSTLAGISGTKVCSSFGNQDYWVIKIDENNNILWQNCFGGSGSDELFGITATPEGDALLYGRSDSPISGNKTVGTNGGYDFWVIKVNSDGDVIWQKNYGTTENEYTSVGITIIENNKYLLNTSSNCDINGDKSENTYGFYDYWILAIDSAGNTLWDKTLGGSGNDYSHEGDVLMDQTNNRIIISGSSYSDISGIKTNQNYGEEDTWVVSVDVNGNILDQNTIGGDFSDFGKPFFIDGNNEVHFIGTSYSGVSGNKTSPNNGSSDFWYFKLNTDLDLIIDWSYGGSGVDNGLSGIQNSSNQFVFSGFSNSSISGDKTENNRGFGDAWTIGVNSTDGNIIWQKTIGGSSTDGAKYIFETPTTYKIFCDSESPISFDKTVPNISDVDFWIFDLSKTVGLDVLVSDNRKVFPNPSTGVFLIDSKENESYRIVDTKGVDVEFEINNGILNIDHLQNGTYFLIIQNEDNGNQVLKLMKAD